jgi:predicted transcriptional regulator
MPSPTTLKLPGDLKARLSALADAEGKTPHAYMVEALQQVAERAERRREYLEEGERRWRDYQRNGIAYAMEDVEPYILGIAAGKKPPRPKPLKVTGKKR